MRYPSCKSMLRRDTFPRCDLQWSGECTVTQYSRLPADRTRSAIPWMRWASRAGLALLILGIAVSAGFQIAQPDKRVLQVVAAGLILLLAFKTRSISALVLAVLFLPFPRSTSYGNTN